MRLTTKTIVNLEISKNIHVIIRFYHIDDKDLINKCIRRIFCFINVFGNSKYLHRYNGAEFDILLYYAPRIITKGFQNNTNEMNEIGNKCYFNCICGYAYIDNGKFKICVSRKNGCLGLLTHELGHICELDGSHFTRTGYIFPNNRWKGWQFMVKKYFDISKNCIIGNMSEGINNGNSSVIHAMFLTFENNRKTNYFTKYYNDELIHSIEMTARLLRWYGYKSVNELLHSNDKIYTQKSQMLEYILIRCVYLLYYDKLSNWNTMDDEQYIIKFTECLLK